MTQQKGSLVRSMTGQGHSSALSEFGSVQVEIRTVNSRGFKCVPRLSESLVKFESKIEALVRNRVHRGTIHLHVAFRYSDAEEIPAINALAMNSYLDAIRKLRERNEDLAVQVDLASLLNLPGVLSVSKVNRSDDQQNWSFIEQAIIDSIDNLDSMRIAEGQRMSLSLMQDCDQITERLKLIQTTSPRSVDVYRQRLQSKIERALQDHGLQVPTVDLLREVQIYADRVDIHEEIVRLGSHLKMFSAIVRGDEESSQPMGRKLDFVLQEMFRETNTIGSKASDAEISSHVVEIKCAIERMRELVQNLE